MNPEVGHVIRHTWPRAAAIGLGSVLVATLAWLAGCGGHRTDMHGIPGTCPDGAQRVLPVGTPVPRLDILAVIDDSASIDEEQLALAVGARFMFDSLLDPDVDPATGLPGHLPVADVHVGVINMNMGTGGYPLPECTDPVDGDDGVLLHEPPPWRPECDPEHPPFVSCTIDEPGCSERLSNEFGCYMVLGSHGCVWEQAFKAVTRALVDHRYGANAGFLRDDSILVLVFVSDEEEWSVAPGSESIFDMSDPTLGPISLRPFNHPEMLVPVVEYEGIFDSFRTDPERILLAFFVGVPMDPACEGPGDQIGTCLDHPDMIERINPATMLQLVPACDSSSNSAFPGRRYVEMALHFGERAIVHASCNSSYRPAVEMLTEKIGERVGSVPLETALPAERDADDPCACSASCTLVQKLAGEGPCPPHSPCLEPGGPGTGCAFDTDEEGARALCTLSQASTRLEDCSAECDAPGARRSVEGGGSWFYTVSPSGPRIVYTAAFAPEPAAELYLSCCI